MIVRGGDLVTPAGVIQADLAVEDGIISAVGPGISGSGPVVDASGMTILPGLIDVHVHFNEPGRTEWEGAATGSRALAAGGGTTFFDMPLNSSPCTVSAEAFRLKQAALERSSITDFALWGGIVPGNRDALAEMGECGTIGFKAFMADSGLPEFPRSDDRTLFEGMREAARLGLVVAVHAENADLVQPLAAGGSVRDFLSSRPVLAEVEAIQRAGLLAREAGVKLHIVHISSGRGIAAALEARAAGTDISLETCPHYLYFTEDDMERMGAVLKCAPPLRPSQDRVALRHTVINGAVDIVGSDHSPAPPEMKQDANFFRVWGGVAGVQSTLGVLLEIGCTPQRAAALLAHEPARRFGLHRKGRLEPGCDADFTFVDLQSRGSVARESLFQRHAFSPYIGLSLRGTVRRTILRGRTIFADGRITAESCGKMVTHAQSRIHA